MNIRRFSEPHFGFLRYCLWQAGEKCPCLRKGIPPCTRLVGNPYRGGGNLASTGGTRNGGPGAGGGLRFKGGIRGGVGVRAVFAAWGRGILCFNSGMGKWGKISAGTAPGAERDSRGPPPRISKGGGDNSGGRIQPAPGGGGTPGGASKSLGWFSLRGPLGGFPNPPGGAPGELRETTPSGWPPGPGGDPASKGFLGFHGGGARLGV